MGQPLRTGMIGCGNINAAYLATFPRQQAVKLVASADIDYSRAEAVARDRQGLRALTVEDLLADDEVSLVLNLTISAAHAEVALRAIAAGKSVYGEKPRTTTPAFDGWYVVEGDVSDQPTPRPWWA